VGRGVVRRFGHIIFGVVVASGGGNRAVVDAVVGLAGFEATVGTSREASREADSGEAEKPAAGGREGIIGIHTVGLTVWYENAI
jgi:hypothetical protein